MSSYRLTRWKYYSKHDTIDIFHIISHKCVYYNFKCGYHAVIHSSNILDLWTENPQQYKNMVPDQRPQDASTSDRHINYC